MDKIVIFYLPFELSTYAAVTPTLIEKEAICKFVLSRGDKNVDRLKNTLKDTRKGSFDKLVVRVKMSGIYDTDIYVDQDGGLWRDNGDGGKTAHLRERAFKQLDALMKQLYKENPKACKVDVDYLLGK